MWLRWTSSDDNDDNDEEEFNFDNLFVSHLDDILGYMYCSADKGIDDVLQIENVQSRTRGHAAPWYAI